MRIEDLTRDGGVGMGEMAGARLIKSEEEGTTSLVSVEGTDGVKALMFMPAESDTVEFICAGRPSTWMKDVSDNYINERISLMESGQLSKGNASCDAEAFETATNDGFRLVANSVGDLDFVKEYDGFTVSITNDAWAGEPGPATPGPDDEVWVVTRVQASLVGDDDAGMVGVMEEVSLTDAIEIANQMAQLAADDVNDNVFSTVDDFHAEHQDKLGIEQAPRQMSMF